MDKQRLGKYGEKLACSFLKKKGYRILDRNFYTKLGEIDIVARDQNEIVFVEVKTRTDNKFGYPEGSINTQKQRHIARMAEIYIQNKKIFNVPMRIDAVSIELDNHKKDYTIKHFINISY